MESVTLEVTTNGSGVGSVQAARGFGTGFARFLVMADWRKGTFANGVDAVLSVVDSDGNENALLTLTDANSNARYYVRTDEHDNAGSADTSTTLYVIDGALKLSVTSGGDTKTGKMVVYLLDG